MFLCYLWTLAQTTLRISEPKLSAMLMAKAGNEDAELVRQES